MNVILKTIALGLIKTGKAKAESLVYCANRDKTYMAISRYDTQTTDHYLVGVGDMRDTHASD